MTFYNVELSPYFSACSDSSQYFVVRNIIRPWYFQYISTASSLDNSDLCNCPCLWIVSAREHFIAVNLVFRFKPRQYLQNPNWCSVKIYLVFIDKWWPYCSFCRFFLLTTDVVRAISYWWSGCVVAVCYYLDDVRCAVCSCVAHLRSAAFGCVRSLSNDVGKLRQLGTSSLSPVMIHHPALGLIV